MTISEHFIQGIFNIPTWHWKTKLLIFINYLVSHGLDVKAYGFDVKAPTGHRSMTFPDSSDLIIFSTYVPTCMSPPLPVVPKSSTPATSLANL